MKIALVMLMMSVLLLLPHPASSYQQIEAKIGDEIPDFSFTDFNGQARKLSDFKGKYVLLDFWGTWCSPCVAELPALKEVYGKFRVRNFEILGMDNEFGWEHPSADERMKLAKRAQAFIAEKNIPWTQATSESIATLAQERFRVKSYPMKLLLDPQRRVVLKLGVKGFDELTTTLEKLLPPAR